MAKAKRRYSRRCRLLGYNHAVDPLVQRQLALLERRSRTLTGIILAVVAFVATYGLMLFEGQVDRPGFHYYPWILAALFYLAGDILAFVWFKTVSIHLVVLLAAKKRRAEEAEPDMAEDEGVEEVEIIRPENVGS